MGRSVLAAAVERPAWRRGDVASEGPDEDAFTLSVAVLERLAASARFRGDRFARVQVVGPAHATLGPSLGDALGEGPLEVRVASGGAAALYAALATATGSHASEGPEAVVAVDTAGGGGEGSPLHGAGAVAFGIAEGGGLAVGPHGERYHPPERRPDATAWVEAVRRATSIGSELRGTLLVRAPAPAPVLLAFWTRTLPQVPVALAPPPEPWAGPAPHLGPALDLLYAARQPSDGPLRVVATIAADRTVYGGFSAEAPLDVVGPPPASPDPRERTSSLDRPPLAQPAVSEGAYLPRPRYLEALPSRWRLVAERCPACGHRTFPARGACRGCGRSEGLVAEELPREGGVVEARTTVRQGAQPTEFDGLVEETGGYDVALVRLAPDVLATFQVADARPGTTPVGARVAARLRRLYATEGEWRYGRKVVVVPP